MRRIEAWRKNASAFRLRFSQSLAIPALLDMMSIEGVVVTIAAMGRRRDIATRVIEKKADCIIALNGNQGALREDVEVFQSRVDPFRGSRQNGADTSPSCAIALRVDRSSSSSAQSVQ